LEMVLEVSVPLDPSSHSVNDSNMSGDTDSRVDDLSNNNLVTTTSLDAATLGAATVPTAPVPTVINAKEDSGDADRRRRQSRVSFQEAPEEGVPSMYADVTLGDEDERMPSPQPAELAKVVPMITGLFFCAQQSFRG
jgi:hypothetical protein